MARTNGTDTGTDPFASLRYIPCEVEPGMFKEEYLVHLSARDPQDPERTFTVKLLVDKRDVAGIKGTPRRGAPKPAYLRVEIIKKKKGLALIVLPQPAVPDTEGILVDEADVRKKEEVAT